MPGDASGASRRCRKGSTSRRGARTSTATTSRWPWSAPGGVQTKAAELLGMSFRSFRYYAKKFNLR